MASRSPSRPWWEEILRGERQGFLADSVRRAARVGSLGYEWGMKSRELAYKRGWFSVKRLPYPTICVGNITVGGTGKTPLVIRLATDLLAAGMKPAILLRGYKRRTQSRRPVLVRDAQRLWTTVDHAGDEAMELALRLPGAVVGVGADRHAVGRFLLNHGAIDCFILDDGFQHHRLERDINIVTLDVTDPWGGGALLPAGFLREPPDALRRADAVVLTRASSVAPERLAVLRQQVTGFMRANSSLMESRHEPRALVALGSKKQLPVSELRGRPVLAVSGIGNPQSFESTLASLGARLIDSLRLGDHDGDAAVVSRWIAQRRDTRAIVVMTEKDAMRWQSDLETTPSQPVFALRMELVLSSGRPHWQHLISLIRRLSHARPAL